jgi:hypothetical protein
MIFKIAMSHRPKRNMDKTFILNGEFDSIVFFHNSHRAKLSS